MAVAASPILYLDRALGITDQAGNYTITYSNNDIYTDNASYFNFDAEEQVAFTSDPDNVKITLSRNASSFSVWFITNTDFYAKGNYTGRGTILGVGGGSFPLRSLWVQTSPPYRIFGETTVNNEEYIDIAGVIPGDTWTNVTVVCDSGVATAYINNIERGTKTITGDLEFSTLSAIVPGNLIFDVDFRGNIGPVQFWDRTLTRAEVRDNYNHYAPTFGRVLTTVTAERYNDLRTLVNKVLGNSVSSTPNYGYGQTFNTSSVVGDYDTNLAATNKVTAQQYEDLYIDLVRVRAHQIGTTGLSIAPFFKGDYDVNLVDTDKIELTHIEALENLAANIETDRFLVDVTGQAQIVDLDNGSGAATTSTRFNSVSGNWNGTINHVFDVSFDTAQDRRHFFNAGGEVRFSASVAYTGSQAKTVDWQDEMSAMGVSSFRATNTINNNSQGSGTNIGNYDLSGSYKLCYSKAGGASYARNDYRINALNLNSTTIRFKVEFNDGRPNDTTWGIDEPVLGDFTSTVELLQPTGSVTINGVEHTTVDYPDSALPSSSVVSNL